MLARQLWTAQRFGLTPRKLAGRAARAGVPRVLVVSLPKAGTHLVERAVWGMLPKGPLGRQIYKKLKVYAGAEHPHVAQQPKPLKFNNA